MSTLFNQISDSAKKLCWLVAMAATIPVIPANAGEQTFMPTAQYNFGSKTYPDLGSLISNYNAAWQIKWDECKAAGNPAIGYTCIRNTIVNSAPYGTARTNGNPLQYELTNQYYSEYTDNWVGTIPSSSQSTFVISAPQGCPSGPGYSSQSSGPATDYILTCIKLETLSCGNDNDNAGNPINVATQCKLEHEVDYATADGLLRVERSYTNQRGGWVFDTLPTLLEVPTGTNVSAEGVLFGAKLNCPDMIINNWQRYKASAGDPMGTETYANYRCMRPVNRTASRMVHLWINGQHYRFVGSSNPVSADGLAGLYMKLYSLSPPHSTGAVWKVTIKSGDVLYFLSNGKIARREFASGGYLDYSFNTDQRLASKTDHKGRTLTYNYDTYKRLTSIDLPNGEEVTYDYGTDPLSPNHGLLQKIIWPDGGFVEYLYNEAAHLSGSNNGLQTLTGKLDAEGRRIGTYKYSSGDATSTEGYSGIEKKSILDLFTYTRVTDALNTERRIYYGTTLADGRQLQTQDWVPAGSGSTAGSAFILYETDGRLKERRDYNGNKTQYVLDSTRGLETVRVEGIPSANSTNYRTAGVTLPAGVSKTTTEWHSSWNEPKKIAEPGKLTTYIYDGDSDPFNSNITDDCSPATLPEAQLCRVVEQATTDTNGYLGFSATLDSNYTARQHLYTYNSRGQLLTDTRLPDNVVVETREYFETNDDDYKIGDLQSVTNALNQTTEFDEYNLSGYPLHFTDPNGIETTLTYDERDRLLTQTVDGDTTTYDYDLHGNLISVETPDGTLLSYEYDPARRLTAIEDETGSRIEYEYDLESNLRYERIKDPGNTLVYVKEQVYDALSRLMRVVDSSAVYDVHTYDRQGNETGVTDQNSQATTNTYDTLNRLIKIVDPQNGSTMPTEYTYDTRNNLTSVKDPRALTTSYQYNGFHEVTQQTSPDTGTTTYTYDDAGNRISQTDAKSVTINYEYDDLDRLTLVNAPGTDDDISYTYDSCTLGVGRLCSVTRDDITLNYAYDAQGNIVNVEQEIGSTNVDMAYNYDANNRLESITYPSGVSILYTYDTAGKIEEISLNDGATTTSLIDAITYQPMGPVKGYDPANGVDLDIIYDLDGRIETITAGSVVDRDYGFDLVGNINLIDESILTGLDRSYTYDAINRLSLEEDITGTTTVFDYAYDAAGNRTLYDDTVTSQTLTYSSTSNRLTAIGVQSVTSDNNGNTTGIHGYTLAYDVYNRLNSATVSSTTTTYAYNGLGERTTKTTGSNTSHYFYGAEEQLLAEYDALGDITREYVYLNGQPVVMLEHVGSTINKYWIHNDHLGRPLVLTDAAGDAVWQLLDSDAFGNAADIDEDPDNDSTNLVFNLRLPGQYFDAETNLHYNYFRDYNPRIGRYVESDPIGIQGGVNTYLYALANPLRFLDSTGWSPEEHRENQRESNREKHEEGLARKQRDRGGEKGDENRRPPRKRPPEWKGPWPPTPKSPLFTPLILWEMLQEMCRQGIYSGLGCPENDNIRQCDVKN